MDIIAGWAARIAEEAAPDEIDLAPAIAQAFIQGGKEREQLFLSSRCFWSRGRNGPVSMVASGNC